MFELPEFLTLAKQMNETIKGKRIREGSLGNAIAQDILFRAHLHPRHPIGELTKSQKRQLYNAIVKTVKQAIEKGGRYDERDLYGNAGGYVRLMDKNALDRPCPGCGRRVNKLQYLGGACYFCPACQK